MSDPTSETRSRSHLDPVASVAICCTGSVQLKFNLGKKCYSRSRRPCSSHRKHELLQAMRIRDDNRYIGGRRGHNISPEALYMMRCVRSEAKPISSEPKVQPR